MADYIGTGFPQFFCALVQMRYSIGENRCGHILGGGGGLWREDSEGKGDGKKGGKGKRGCGYGKAIAVQLEPQI